MTLQEDEEVSLHERWLMNNDEQLPYPEPSLKRKGTNVTD